MKISSQILSIFVIIREVKRDHSIDTFKHPKLLKEELRLGCKLGLDSWVDTGCAGRRVHAERNL